VFENSSQFIVVANREEQYSIWPLGRELPLGWQKAGPSGSRDECLDYIERTWTDMRPLSLREEMDGAIKSDV
jgi:MbtH protein